MDRHTVISPCKNVCEYDEKKDSCSGCKRTVKEIEDWLLYTDFQRLTIMKELKKRL